VAQPVNVVAVGPAVLVVRSAAFKVAELAPMPASVDTPEESELEAARSLAIEREPSQWELGTRVPLACGAAFTWGIPVIVVGFEGVGMADIQALGERAA